MPETVKKPKSVYATVETIVGIFTLPVILWHGCMMQAANEQSRAANILNAEQLEISRSQRAEDHKREAGEARPILAVTTRSVEWDFEKKVWSRAIVVKNLGKGIAFDIAINWEIRNGVGQQVAAEPSHLMPGETLEFTTLPPAFVGLQDRPLVMQGEPGRAVVADLKLHARTVDNSPVESTVSAEASYILADSSHTRKQSLEIVFRSMVVRPLETLKAIREHTDDL